ncbi:MAG: acyl-CoA synthetase FdrA [Proteobacteria bacterium]|nr:acyl-CoA synthetase FdrA [Pseudomonadota bacterium]
MDPQNISRSEPVPISRTVKTNLYKDSVALMRIAQTVLARDGVRRATLVMGTPANKDILAEAGLFDADLANARPGDVMIVVDAESDDAVQAAGAEIARLLEGEPPAPGSAQAARVPLRSIAMAREGEGAPATLAQISVPGPYAGAEAMKALRQGLHVFLFSDNVPLEHERAIKMVARDKGLLVMGPDCGTAIIGGTPLGFANVVKKGEISLVGASGTGLQEVTCQIDALGCGIRHAIGTGGRDVSADIGGITMRQAIDLLAADPGTRVIGIVSKPPAPEVARQVLERAGRIGKPFVVLFLGDDLSTASLPNNVVAVATLYEAAAAAVRSVAGTRSPAAQEAEAWRRPVQDEAARLASGQRFVRGLYSGGTFCAEAQLVWRDLGFSVHSNAPLDKHAPAVASGNAHTAIDLGADEFTVGRPHPMIDPSTRIDHIAAAARDPSTAAIVLDVVLGYGSHPDPAGALAPAIAAARAASAKEGRYLPVVSFVCGTEGDPQHLSAQQALLRSAGVLVLPGSTAAARAAGEIARRT